MQENDKLNPEELQSPKLATLPVLPVDPTELEAEEKIMEGVEEVTPDDLDKKNYLKVSPTFYIQSVKGEEVNDEGEKIELFNIQSVKGEEVNDEGEKIELFKILNPETGVVETRELTDEEEKELLITELKRSKEKFNPLSHPTKTVGTSTVTNIIGRDRQVKNKEVQTNVLINQFGTKYKQKRRRRNSLVKKSRQQNRK